MENELNNLSEITQYLNIFRGKKAVKSDNSEWFTVNDYLYDMDIVNHFNGNAILAYVITNSTDIFCFDIDLHGNYLNSEIKNLIKIDRYNYITERFGAPSLIFQSSKSGGLHLYYKIDHKIFFEILKAEILKKLNIQESELNKKGIEIRPTPKNALRLPYAIRDGGAILNYDLKYLFEPTAENAQKVIDYILKSNVNNYIELFDGAPELSDIWLRQKTKKRQFENYRLLNRLEKYESAYIPELIQGNTNRPICNIIANCFFNGLNQDQCLIRLDNILDKSNITRNKDTSSNRLSQRIESEYKRLSKNNINKLNNSYTRDNKIVDLFQDIKIDGVIKKLCLHMWPHLYYNQDKLSRTELSTLSKKRNMYKSFLNNLYRWKNYIDNLSEYDRQVINLKYQYFYWNTKKYKLTPLPKILLRKWNDRYYSIIKDLQKIGVLKLRRKYFNPYKAKMYNSDIKGICNYYEVNFDI
jgi:hypothetical protein